MEMTAGRRMALVAAEYKTTCLIYSSAATGVQQVLERNPRRFYVEFKSVGSNPLPTVYPGSIPSGAVAGDVETDDRKYKYHDCPGIVTGEWLITTTDIPCKLMILTDEYVGD